MIKIFISATFIILLCQCDKPDLTVYTITGYLYDDCTMTPVANEELQLIENFVNQPWGGGNSDDEVRTSATTNSDGYFKFEYSIAKETSEDLFIWYESSGSEAMSEIPIGEDLDNIVVYKQPSCNFQVSLNVINSYSEEDMLVIANYAEAQDDTIWGPFSSGVLYTATNFSPLEYTFTGTPMHSLWYVNYPNDHHQTDFVITKFCNDTTFVTVDIY